MRNLANAIKIKHQHDVEAAGVTVDNTLAADAEEGHFIDNIIVSYDATPSAAAKVTIIGGSVKVLDQWIPSAGPHQFFVGYQFPKNTEVIVSLEGDAGFIGKVDVYYQ